MAGSAKTLTKEDWTAAAMELLRTQGIGGVRILPLAKAMKVTRGSFYWHFGSRQELLVAMLDWWERKMTDTVIQHTQDAVPRSRLTELAEIIMRRDLSRYDGAIRTWAFGDRKAATVQRRVMTKRLEYVTSLFREEGFSPTEAEARGHLMAIYIMSEAVVHGDQTLETRLRLFRRQITVLLQPD